MADTSGRWLYAIARELDTDALTGLRGVAGAPVHVVEDAGLVAVVSAVDLAEFGAEPLKRNLEDLDWLAATARAHDAVVTTVGGAAPAAVPLRLATVCLGDDRVRELLIRRRPDLESALALLTGRTEWGVKAYADPDALAAADAPAEPGGQGGQGSKGGAGTAYLLRRKAQLSAREKAERNASAHADRLHRELAALATAARRHPPQDPKLSGRKGWNVLNGAYLVDDAKADELAAAVERLGGEVEGVRLELTGPWPAYSFAGVEQGAEEAAR
ncbi:GvpL/GvpF family gas vesicle protein [Prauserella endophytica]|uniref:GvpL/GvpF family gas vesicle protein n=1 Tax=Prauserella endophytica TaxID=1592324 RepID=A0ABY2S3W3_9PSEU|nr:GvpL/GvpF family gas vesicle protein [Prauserella endophytica]TKG70480.1 GvpL/GvpF family gas vesicle protein [Prauserella endophytica]